MFRQTVLLAHSEGSFVNARIAKALHLKGIEVTKTLDTFGEPVKFETSEIEGIKIAHIDGEKPAKISLMSTNHQIPIRETNVPRSCDLAQYPHMSFVKSLPDLEICLMLGNYVPAIFCIQQS